MKMIYKKIVSMLIIISLILPSNVNASVVSDNDGSAFVTKAEFDALKENFANQIENYENSIEGKIDGAIAAYLAALKTANLNLQDSIINELGIGFNNEFAYPETCINHGFQAYLQIGYGCAEVYAAGKCMDAEYKVGNNNLGSWVLYSGNGDDTDKSKYLKVKQSKYDEVIYFYPKKCIESLPRGGIKAAGWDHGMSWNTTFTGPVPKTYVFTNEQFGMQEVSVSGFTMGGSAHTVNGIYYNKPDDTESDWIDQDNVYGGLIPTATMSCIEQDDINKVGPLAGICTANVGFASLCRRYVDGTTIKFEAKYRDANTNNQLTAAQCAEQKCSVYYHSSFDLANIDLINDAISVKMNKPITYYNGLPIFTATTNGEVRVMATFNNTDDATSTFELKNDKFDNEAVTTGKVTGIEDANIPSFSVASGETVTWTWKVTAGTTYWIKAVASSGITNITTESIIITTE